MADGDAVEEGRPRIREQRHRGSDVVRAGGLVEQRVEQLAVRGLFQKYLFQISLPHPDPKPNS
mgnify:CR=1 FL=1